MIMRKGTVIYRAALLILSLALFLPLLSNFVYAEKEKAPPVNITLSLSESRDSLTISGQATGSLKSSDGRIYLFRCLPAEFNNPKAPLDSIPYADEFTFTVQLDINNPSLALYGYGIGVPDKDKGYRIVSNNAYLNDLSVFTRITPFEEAPLLSKKGLEVQLSADAADLGVSYTVVPCYLNELIPDSATIKDLLTSKNGAGLTPFTYGGNQYYINTAALGKTDYRIKVAASSGIRVYLNLLLSYNEQSPLDLYTEEGHQNGKISVPNAEDTISAKRLGAIVHFLTERYGDENSEFGQCRRLILGYENDDTGIDLSKKQHDTDQYIHNMTCALRIVDAAARSANGNARCYLSLSHHWADKSVGIGARDMLSSLMAICPDVPFGIAINPNPSSSRITDERQDPKITNETDTPYLTMANIGILSALLQSDSYLNIDKSPRSLVIFSYGIGSDGTEASQRNQAAAFLRAYLTAQNDPLVEAFIWHRHVDFTEEQGGGFGLYTAKEALLQPEDKKLLYDVFAQIDTDKQAEIIGDYRSEIGEELADLYLSSERKAQRIVTIGNSITGKFEIKSTLFDFNKSLYDFYPTFNSGYIEQCINDENGSEYRYLHSSLTVVSPIEWMGITCPFVDYSPLVDSDSIGIKLRITGTDVPISVRVKLSFFSLSDGVKTEWTAETLTESDDWQTVWFSTDSLVKQSPDEGFFALLVLPENNAGKTGYYLDVADISVGVQKHPFAASGTFKLILILSITTIIAASAAIFVPHLVRRAKAKQSDETNVPQKAGKAHRTWLHTGAMLRRSKELKEHRKAEEHPSITSTTDQGELRLKKPPRVPSRRRVKKIKKKRRGITKRTGFLSELKRRWKRAVYNYRMADSKNSQQKQTGTVNPGMERQPMPHSERRPLRHHASNTAGYPPVGHTTARQTNGCGQGHGNNATADLTKLPHIQGAVNSPFGSERRQPSTNHYGVPHEQNRMPAAPSYYDQYQEHREAMRQFNNGNHAPAHTPAEGHLDHNERDDARHHINQNRERQGGPSSMTAQGQVRKRRAKRDI